MLICFFLLIILPGCQSGTSPSTPASGSPIPHATILSEHQYLVHQQLDLVNEGPGQPEKQNLWVALIRDFPPYQQAQITKVSPEKYTLITDEYGTDPTLRFRNTSVNINALTMISKRVESGEPVDVSLLVEKNREALTEAGKKFR